MSASATQGGHNYLKLGARGTVDIYSNRVKKGGTSWTVEQSMRPASTHLKVNFTDLDIPGWASSWTSPLSHRPPGGIPAGKAAECM